MNSGLVQTGAGSIMIAATISRDRRWLAAVARREYRGGTS
jgi:hypothetical protein